MEVLLYAEGLDKFVPYALCWSWYPTTHCSYLVDQVV